MSAISSIDLYHYQRFDEDWLRETIVDRKIYLSSPGSINDPWDCQPFFNLARADDAACREKLAHYFEGLARKYPGVTPPNQIRARIEAIRADPAAARYQLVQQSSGLSQMIAGVWRMYCLTPICDSELMWAHYADRHRGLCIGFRRDSELMKHAAQVSYHQEYPDFDFTNEDVPHEVLLAKSIAWGYEQEFRLLAQERQHAVPGAEGLLTDENRLAVPPATLSSVILGALADEDTERRVGRLVSESAEPIVLVRAVRSPNRYGLTFRRVDEATPSLRAREHTC